MLYDIHVHTIFSHDGKSTVEDYARAYPQKDKYGFGFTEHIDFMPECGGYGIFDYSSYRSTVDKYREMGFAYHAGAEIDYADKVKNDIIGHLTGHSYDYTICSVHMLDGISVSDGRNIGMLKDPAYFCNVIHKYYNEIFSSFKGISFDVLGHIGIYKRYLDDSFYTAELVKLENELLNTLAEICAVSGRLLEVNTSGLNAPLGKTLPDEVFLRRYKEKGGAYVCIGSDAHSAKDVFRGFKEAKAMLASLGFNYIYLPWDRERPVKLGSSPY